MHKRLAQCKGGRYDPVPSPRRSNLLRGWHAGIDRRRIDLPCKQDRVTARRCDIRGLQPRRIPAALYFDLELHVCRSPRAGGAPAGKGAAAVLERRRHLDLGQLVEHRVRRPIVDVRAGLPARPMAMPPPRAKTMPTTAVPAPGSMNVPTFRACGAGRPRAHPRHRPGRHRLSAPGWNRRSGGPDPPQTVQRSHPSARGCRAGHSQSGNLSPPGVRQRHPKFSNSAVERYRSAKDGRMTTMFLPVMRGRPPISRAAATAAPEEIPPRMPSCRARSRAVSKAF